MVENGLNCISNGWRKMPQLKPDNLFEFSETSAYDWNAGFDVAVTCQNRHRNLLARDLSLKWWNILIYVAAYLKTRASGGGLGCFIKSSMTPLSRFLTNKYTLVQIEPITEYLNLLPIRWDTSPGIVKTILKYAIPPPPPPSPALWNQNHSWSFIAHLFLASLGFF